MLFFYVISLKLIISPKSITSNVFFEQITTNILSQQYQNLKLLFPGIKLSENIYKTRAKKVKEDIVWLAKKDKEKKKLFLESFCQESWKSLSNFKQQRHASFECKGCLGDETYRTYV